MSTQDYEILLKVRADLQQALGKLGDLNKGIRGIGDTAREVAGIVGVSFGLHEIVDFAKSIIDAQAHMVDLNQQTGISVENLSALQFIAHKNGVEIDALGGSLSKLAVEAAKNNPAFAAMGISVKDSNGHLKDTSTLLAEVAKKFAGYQDGPEKAALANALFGKSGYGLIQMLDQLGTEGLDRVKQKAKEAGALLGGDTARQAKQFADSLDDLKVSAKNAVAQGIDAMLPELQNLVDLAKDPEAQQGLQAIGEGIGAIGIAAGKAIITLGQFIDKAGQVIEFAQTDGAVYSPGSRQIAQLQFDADVAELSRRGSDPNSLNEKSGRLRRSVFTWSDSQSRAALKSTDELLADIAKHAHEIAKYDNSHKEPNAQEGDTRGLFVGLGGAKSRAPLLPDPETVARAKALAAAFAQLQSQLASLKVQGLGPTATAWAQYNKTVADATDTAKKAGNTPEALATLKAIKTEAARIRDAQIDKIAEQDRQAWEALKRSFETPAQVRVDDAIAQIKKLNDELAKGVITSQQYHDALGQIGEKAVAGALPTYQGLDATVGGSYSELGKNYQAEKDLDAAYQAQKLALDKKFNDQDEAQYAAHMAALTKLDADRSKEQKKIEDARGQLQLQAASDLFGQLATLSTSHNKKMAAIGKAAAIAQAIIRTYETANEAMAALSGIPVIGPALGYAAAAVAIAAGLANVAQIRSQNVGGYAGGGPIKGPGTATSDSVPILASNGEYMQRAAAVQYYGVPFMDAVNNLRYPRYADGGLIHPMANAPSPAELGFVTPERPSTAALQTAANDDAHARQPQSVRVVVALNEQDIANATAGAAGERVFKMHAKANIPTLRAWINGKG